MQYLQVSKNSLKVSKKVLKSPSRTCGLNTFNLDYLNGCTCMKCTRSLLYYILFFYHDLGELTIVLGWNFAGRIGLWLYNTFQILLFLHLWPHTNLNIKPFEVVAYWESVLHNSFLSFQTVNPDLNLNFVSNFMGLISNY